MTDCARLLNVLSDGKPHSHNELYRLGMVVHSRISDLRGRGHDIRCERFDWRDLRGHRQVSYRYRLVGPLDAEGNARPSASSGSADDGAGFDPFSSRPGGLTAAEPLAVSLDEYGVDRAVGELNAECPGMLVEPDRPLPIQDQRVQLEKLQRTLWPEAA